MIRTVTGDIQEAACMAAAEGYRLKIYDAYRPQRAVDHFMRGGRFAGHPDET